ncbi:MAG: hypothetical protein GWN14_05300 [candidate division Zixibacteria bacterium]|nr:hypothetical protein [candidate division Zixibacteria bacterium]
MSILKPEKKIRRRFDNKNQAVNAGWPEKIDDVSLSVANYNHLATFASAMLRVDRARDQLEVRRASIAAFREQNEIVNNAWVLKPSIMLQGSGLKIQNKFAPQVAIEGNL